MKGRKIDGAGPSQNQPFDTIRTIAGLLVGDTLLEKLMQRRPEACEVVEGDRIATGGAHLVDVDHDYGACAGDDLDPLGGDQVVELFRTVLEWCAFWNHKIQSLVLSPEKGKFTCLSIGVWC